MARPTKLELENRALQAELQTMRELNNERLRELDRMRHYNQTRDTRLARLALKLSTAQTVIIDQAQQIVTLRTNLAAYRTADFILHEEVAAATSVTDGDANRNR